MAPRSALDLLPQVRAPIATIQGRYWAMDRDKRWDRTQRAYDAIVDAAAPSAASAHDAVLECYAKAECGDELMEPRVVGKGARVEDGDAVVFINFRPDRARQLTWAFLQDEFDGFARRRRPRDLRFATMTEYKVGLPNVRVAFAPQEVIPMAQLLAERGLRQLRAAETEKYAHVTYFFNGGREVPFAGEDRELVPSAKVATYDLRPAMSAAAVAMTLVKALETGSYDFAIVNFANPDMVGHTGDIAAALEAMAATDADVGAVVNAAVAAGGCVLVTADHGNVEEMLFPDGSRNTQHSLNPVPVVVTLREDDRRGLADGGLRDVAPTLLELMGIPAPDRMTGRSLLTGTR